ncbi:uncharacterized protein [Halyomorpha halys]|uniref:uncharacterized protein n=1 Tax=Halyomorpha halys TaxID=286706 RepID=UPI0006D4CEF8|nr:integumentary mucin C.1-like [Halyomorpha halys]
MYQMSWEITLGCCLMLVVIPHPGNTLGLSNLVEHYREFFAGNGSTTEMLNKEREAVNAIASINSLRLNSVVNATKQVLDAGAQITAGIPVVGHAVGLGTDVIKAGADAVNSVGQAKISFFQNLKNAQISILEKLFGGSASTTATDTTSSQATSRTTTTIVPTTPTTSTTSTTKPTISLATKTTTVPITTTASSAKASTTTTKPTTSLATNTTTVPITTTTSSAKASTTTSIPTTAGMSPIILVTVSTSTTTTAATPSGYINIIEK